MYSSVVYFLSSTLLGVVLFRRGVSGKNTSLTFSFDLGVLVGFLILVLLRRSTLIPASSSKRENGPTVLVHLHRSTVFPAASSKLEVD